MEVSGACVACRVLWFHSLPHIPQQNTSVTQGSENDTTECVWNAEESYRDGDSVMEKRLETKAFTNDSITAFLLQRPCNEIVLL